jgi:alkyl hydroperoxide reductase subunit AhpC
MPIAIGTKAPDFTLKTKTADGLKDVKLSDNFGKKQTVSSSSPWPSPAPARRRCAT